MQDLGPDMTKSLGQAPRTRTCYICGRGYGLSSYEIHLKQCKDLWIKREEKKPKNERKPLPEDPFINANHHNTISTAGAHSPGGSGGGFSSEISTSQLEAMNAVAQNSYNDVALFKCEWCGRSFLEEKLKIHNRSCTEENPARRVDAKVKVGRADVKISSPNRSAGPPLHSSVEVEPTPPYRPKTTGSGGRPKHKIQIEEIKQASDARGSTGYDRPVAGNIGGSLVSQSLRNESLSPRGQSLPQNQAPSVSQYPTHMKRDEKIQLALIQLHNLEEANLLMSKSIADLKELIYTLQSDDS